MKQRNLLAWLLALALVLTAVPTAWAATSIGANECPHSPDGHHQYVKVGEKAPTCTEPGYELYRCRYCRDEIKKDVAPLGHAWGGWHVVLEPTCTEKGCEERVCYRDSSHVEKRWLDPLGHDWSDWYVLKAPTYTEPGIMEHKCNRCGITEQELIPPLKQSPEYGLALVMTQTDPGGSVFTFDDLFGGHGITITYAATLINTGKSPLSVADFYAGAGSSGSLKPAHILYPGESYSFPLERDLTEYDIVPVTDSETLYGSVGFDFYFYGDSLEGEKHVCSSNSVYFGYSVTKPMGFEEWPIPSESDVVVTKTLLNKPSDPNGFQLGEQIYYRITVTNTWEGTIPELILYDALATNSDYVPAAVVNDFPSGETFTYDYAVTVNAFHLPQGYIYNIACAVWADPESGEEMYSYSDPITVNLLSKASLMLQKSVVGGPGNGHYYVPGEVVHFQVHVWNNSTVHHKDIMVVDPLTGETKTIQDLPPDASVTLDFYYTVTELDALMTYVENYAYAMEVDNAVSNTVRVDTGTDQPFGVITDISVTKAEVSSPADPKGYQLGETISYVITVTNEGETLIGEGIVMDSLKGGSGEIGSFENLFPTTHRTYYFSHVVTEQDVHNGKVVNQAAVWYELNGHGALQTSLPVESPTWGQDPFGDEFDGEPLLGEEDCCSRTLTGKGDGTDAFAVHYCKEHLELLEALEEKKAQITDEQAELAYLKEARAAWQGAMDALYEAAQEKADSETAAALMTQRLAFLEYLDTYEAFLTSLYPDAPLTVARELLRETENKCVDLCYELHEAPKARVDSVLSGEVSALEDAAPGALCARIYAEREEADQAYTEVLCADHSATDQRAMGLVKEAINREARNNAFLRAQRMWQTMMDNRTNARYKAADKETRVLIAKNRLAFDKYLNARKTLLTVIYPDQPDVVAEIVARIIQDKEMDLCQLWK